MIINLKEQEERKHLMINIDNVAIRITSNWLKLKEKKKLKFTAEMWKIRSEMTTRTIEYVRVFRSLF